MAQFKSGDVVRISAVKGPWMIVESCDDHSAVCFWFDKTDAGHRESFPADFLEQKKTDTGGISGFAGARRREEA
jgi:uncharacterized protein YodC (DUF2158 family)